MIRLAISLASMAIVIACAAANGPVSHGASVAEARKIKVTEKQYKEVVTASDGDLIELWLPSSMPFGWVEIEEHPILQKEKVELGELQEIEKAQKDEGKLPSMGKPGKFAGRYKVKAKNDATTVVKWMYCKFNKLKETEKELASGQIPKPPEFRPDMKAENLRAGIIFQITLQAHPR